MPHKAECGHVYCYICVHKLANTPSDAVQYGIFGIEEVGSTTIGTTGTGTVEGCSKCVLCHRLIGKYRPLSADDMLK